MPWTEELRRRLLDWRPGRAEKVRECRADRHQASLKGAEALLGTGSCRVGHRCRCSEATGLPGSPAGHAAQEVCGPGTVGTGGTTAGPTDERTGQPVRCPGTLVCRLPGGPSPRTGEGPCSHSSIPNPTATARATA